MKKYLHILMSPSRIIDGLMWRFPSLFPDKFVLKRTYKQYFGEKLNLKSPKKFTEKLQWLKLYDRNPLYTQLVDKYAVKEYVAQKIGSEHVVKCYGVWGKFEDIDFDSLPSSFVLKCTHDSGVSHLLIY